MTLAEFKAWLEGFEHSFPPSARSDIQTAAPSPEQWLAIKEKLALVGSIPLAITQGKLPAPGSPDWYKTYVTRQNGQSTALDQKLAM